MLDVPALEAAADLFMEIGFMDRGWQPALEALCAAAGAAGGVLLPIQNFVPGPLVVTDSFKEAVSRYFKDGWHSNDIRMRGLPKMYRTGIATDFDNILPDGINQSQYYQEFLRPAGMAWYAGLGYKSNQDDWVVSFQRRIGSDPFSQSEQAALVAVANRLSRGATAAADLDRARQVGISDVLEAMGKPSLILDRAGKIIRINNAAERLIGRGIEIHDRTITAARPDGVFLSRFISALVSFTEPLPPIASGRISVQRETGRPLVFSGQRLRVGPAWEYFSQARALVTITDLDAIASIDDEIMRSLFNLTPSECNVARALSLYGENAVMTASKLNMSHETVRTHLKSIYKKADVKGQSDLVTLFSRLVE